MVERRDRRDVMRDNYDPKPNRCLGVFNLNLMIEERDLREIFEEYGAVQSTQVIRDFYTKRSRGFGFVYMQKEEDAVKAWKGVHGTEISGCPVRVDFSVTNSPPREMSPSNPQRQRRDKTAVSRVQSRQKPYSRRSPDRGQKGDSERSFRSREDLRPGSVDDRRSSSSDEKRRSNYFDRNHRDYDERSHRSFKDRSYRKEERSYQRRSDDRYERDYDERKRDFDDRKRDLDDRKRDFDDRKRDFDERKRDYDDRQMSSYNDRPLLGERSADRYTDDRQYSYRSYDDRSHNYSTSSRGYDNSSTYYPAYNQQASNYGNPASNNGYTAPYTNYSPQYNGVSNYDARGMNNYGSSYSYNNAHQGSNYGGSYGGQNSGYRQPSYQPQQHTHPSNQEVSPVLGVFGLNQYTTEDQLRDIFTQYGSVDKVMIVYDRETARSRGFGFVYMRHLKDAIQAQKRGHGQDIDGRTVRVEFSNTSLPNSGYKDR